VPAGDSPTGGSLWHETSKEDTQVGDAVVTVETKPVLLLLTLNNVLFAQRPTLSCFTVSFTLKA
jgi:hypothetical protein